MKTSRDKAFLDYDVLEAAYCACDRINAKRGIGETVKAAGAGLRTVLDIEAGHAVAMKDDGGQIRAVYKDAPQQVRYKQATPADEIDRAIEAVRAAAIEAAKTQGDTPIAEYLNQIAMQLAPSPGSPMAQAVTKAAAPASALEAIARGLPVSSVRPPKPPKTDPIMAAIRGELGEPDDLRL
jgi:hypothetical protein